MEDLHVACAYISVTCNFIFWRYRSARLLDIWRLAYYAAMLWRSHVDSVQISHDDISWSGNFQKFINFVDVNAELNDIYAKHKLIFKVYIIIYSFTENFRLYFQWKSMYKQLVNIQCKFLNLTEQFAHVFTTDQITNGQIKSFRS